MTTTRWFYYKNVFNITYVIYYGKLRKCGLPIITKTKRLSHSNGWASVKDLVDFIKRRHNGDIRKMVTYTKGHPILATIKYKEFDTEQELKDYIIMEEI